MAAPVKKYAKAEDVFKEWDEIMAPYRNQPLSDLDKLIESYHSRDRRPLIERGKTRCSKCGSALIATDAQDGGSYADYMATIVFTCPNERGWKWWDRIGHDREYFNIPLWDYRRILADWAFRGTK